MTTLLSACQACISDGSYSLCTQQSASTAEGLWLVIEAIWGLFEDMRLSSVTEPCFTSTTSAGRQTLLVEVKLCRKDNYPFTPAHRRRTGRTVLLAGWWVRHIMISCHSFTVWLMWKLLYQIWDIGFSEHIRVIWIVIRNLFCSVLQK